MPKIDLSAVTPLPILRAPRLRRGRFIDFGSGAMFPGGAHTWSYSASQYASRPMPSSVQEDVWRANGHTMTRLWRWTARDRNSYQAEKYDHLPYELVGGKFDLNRWNEDFFARERDMVERALEMNVVVMLMLDQGHFNWDTHPYHPSMNRNGVDGIDRLRIHQANAPGAVRQRQRDLLIKTMQNLSGLPNIIYEPMNEGPWSRAFQMRCTDEVRSRGGFIVPSSGIRPGVSVAELQSAGGNGIGINWPSGTPYSPEINKSFMLGDEDHNGVFLQSPSPRAVVSLVMSTWLRGLGPLQMDVYPGFQLQGWEGQNWNNPSLPSHDEQRTAIGIAHVYSRRIPKLHRCKPTMDGTGFCLRRGKAIWLVWSFGDQPFTLPLLNRRYRGEWCNVEKRRFSRISEFQASGETTFVPPGRGRLLYLARPKAYREIPDEWVV